jgi:hypothetical protein
MGNLESSTSVRKIEAHQREGEALRLRLQELTLAEIAKRLGYATHVGARKAIHRAMHRLGRPEYAERLRTIEVAKCGRIECEAWEQWKRSCENKATITVKQTPQGEETTKRLEGQCGNPALLEKILAAMKRRAELLGLDLELPSNDGQQLHLHAHVEGQPDWTKVPPEMFLEAMKLAERAKRISANGNGKVLDMIPENGDGKHET